MLLLIVGVLALAGAAAYLFKEPLRTAWYDAFREWRFKTPTKPRPNPEKYAVLAADLQRWRRDLAERHRAARSDEARAAVEQDARVVLGLVLPEMMRCWLGTPWDFNGTAEKPGAGAIACGYFVSTVLKDAGFRVDRYQLAKQPSENILRSFLSRESCTLSVGKNYDVFSTELGAESPGIHLVGLDTHVAFIVTGVEGGFRFIHASGSRPWTVVEESPDEAIVLQRSKWRMLGNLTAEAGLIRRWLRAEKIVVRGA
jgi:hypothetical protein